MVSARERMLERGWSLSSFLTFVRDVGGECVGKVCERSAVARSIVRFALAVSALEIAGALPLYFAGEGGGAGPYLHYAGYAVLGACASTLFALAFLGLLRDLDGRTVAALGLANRLTLARCFLIAPVLVLFAHGHLAAALAAYVVLGLTDVADGVVARRRGERTEFGMVLDPLADVFSTAAIFSLFLSRGLVPVWVFGVLMARYAMLIVGSVVLFLVTGPIRFRATLPGKVVGVVQGTGVVTITVCAMSGRGWLDVVGPVLFPILGAGFASIVLSQAVIGLRHIRSSSEQRRKAVGVES